jgi:lipopolysaccharide export system protein LptA
MKRSAALFLTFCSVATAAVAAQTAPTPPRAPAAAAPRAPRTPNVGLNANAPIAVNADSFLADLNGETGTYTGNVIVTQGEVRLHADQVKVTAPSGRASKMEALGHVVVDSPSGQAVGDNGFYDVPSQVLRLNGNVVLTKEANVMRGSALEISMATGIARLTAGGPPVAAAAPGQPAQPPGRVQGLFIPAPRPGASAPSENANPPKP